MDPFAQILGPSEAVQVTRRFGRRAATVDAPVLLTGESGTGKGLLARAIHRASRRARGPFVAVNCAGVAESLFESEFFGHSRGAFTGAQQSHRGLFEQAHGGTLLLDEIGELSPTFQAKLLTALEDGEVRRVGGERALRIDARVIAATGVDLERAVAEGLFRRDLYHRLLVLSFQLPALRERHGDIEFLAHHFLAHFAAKYSRPIRGLSEAAASRLADHGWPGNVRELAHAIEAAVLACDRPRIAVEHLPDTVTRPGPPPGIPAYGLAPAEGSPGRNGAANGAPHVPPMRSPWRSPAGAWSGRPRGRYSFLGSPEDERRRIREALERCRGNKTRAAAALGMARNTLRAKLRTLGIESQ